MVPGRSVWDVTDRARHPAEHCSDNVCGLRANRRLSLHQTKKPILRSCFIVFLRPVFRRTALSGVLIVPTQGTLCHAPERGATPTIVWFELITLQI